MKKDRRDKLYRIISSYYNELSGDVPASVKRDFINWIMHSQERGEKLAILEELIENEEGNACGEERSRILKDIREQLKLAGAGPRRRQVPLRRVWMRVAAVLIPAVVIVGGYFYLLRDTAPQPQIVRMEVPYGDRTDITLSDGTRIAVNSGSMLTYDENLSGKERIVELSGEAFFEVVRNDAKPFVVKSDGVAVTVLGTKFNVEAYPDQEDISVVLAQGRVSVATPRSGESTLAPNQKLTYDKRSGRVETLDLDDAYQTIGWTSGVTVCQNKSQPEIFNSVARRYNVDIEIAPDVRLTDMKYTISFDAEKTPEMVLNSLKLMTGQFDYQIDGRKITITKPRD